MSTIISVENVSKLYHISSRDHHADGLIDSPHGALADTVGGFLRGPRSWLRRQGSQTHKEELWALKDVTFKVSEGEIVGLIGSNGAGKSTLLKLLSRITEPTTGRIELRGRVGSLLEVGTGFHPELTGRENVFLNGAILGMKREEIDRKFDEIVAFSEVEKFLDTPVKFYSSGMYVRLAFSVAAHLDPEVLIVDEVLAVGDAAFQKKCLGKMGDVARAGRTVLFVSHSTQSVTRLCKRVILISDGRIIHDGAAKKVVEEYLGSGEGPPPERTWPELTTAPGDQVVRLRGVRVCTEQGATAPKVDIRGQTGIEMTYDVLEAGQVLVPNYHVHNDEGVCVFVLQDLNPEIHHAPRERGRYVSTVWIPSNFLAEGRLIVTAAISTYKPMIVHAYERDTISFKVRDNKGGDTARGDYMGPMPGAVRPIFDWTTQQVS